jgi:hypothetical protein
MQRYAGKLDKGRPSTYLKARKNSEISVILIMRQLLHEIRFSKCNSDVNKVASKIDGSKLEQTLKDINKSANRGNKRNTWFCKISNIYWNALKHQKMLRNLLSNYNGPTTFFSSITFNIKEKMYLEVVSKSVTKNAMQRSYQINSIRGLGTNAQQNDDMRAKRIASLIIASTNIKATISTKVQMLEKKKNQLTVVRKAVTHP